MYGICVAAVNYYTGAQDYPGDTGLSMYLTETPLLNMC